MVGRDPRYGDLLFPSIQECASERIYTQQQALQYMDDKVMYPGTGNLKEGRSKSILRDVFVAHVPINDGNFRPKCIYTAVMLRRMMDAILNADTFDDKDYVGNKRLELSGQLISLFFEDLFKTMNSNAVERMNKNSDKTHSSPLDFTKLIQLDTITSGLERAISTGNWDIKRFRMHRKGVSQVLSRLSYMASLGYMTRITPQFEKTRKTSGPRALQPSQVAPYRGGEEATQRGFFPSTSALSHPAIPDARVVGSGIIEPTTARSIVPKDAAEPRRWAEAAAPDGSRPQATIGGYSSRR